ncbi:protein translocase subunit SecD [Oscillospiraceae bacterium DSM 107454]|uniref:Protein translocase subunit SecD n=1 Tax=Ructibacterium gallinarum TaxID=2779355 RepID=A0A9D5R8G5_9FIRM|nr:protein translocase subunit SecD [Ructibacterium gallinarum]
MKLYFVGFAYTKEEVKVSRSLVKFVAIILVIAALFYVGLYGLDITDKVRFPGILDEDGITQGLDLKGGTVIVYKAQSDNPTDDEMNTVVSMLRTRLDNQGYTEATLTRQGVDKVRVELPDVQDAQQAVETLGATAQLIFADPTGAEVMTGKEVKNATAEYGQTEQGMTKSSYYISLELTDEGRTKFAEATGRLASQPAGQNYIAIMMDNQPISMPQVHERIDSNSCIITGEFTAEEAKALAANIKSGQLPFSLEQVEVRTVSATLGDEALGNAMKAGIIGLILVLLFMLLVYRLQGLMADLALIGYVAIVFIIIANLHINLTLPGIAGIILSIGMAVDANVVIFERVKEELRLGKTVRSAVDAGFHRALSAVIDSNITTIISAVILWVLGTGTIKGFGITLFIGIIVSMVSAIFVTKFLLKQMIGMNVKNLWFYGVRKKEQDGTLKGGKA